MSLVFSNSAEKSGLVELIDDNCHSNSVSYPIEQKTRDVNLAMDKAYSLIFQSGGTWQFDDGNHTDYPFIMTSLVSGQRDYTFTTDENGNIILDIYKVMIKTGDSATDYYTEIFPVDQQSDSAMSSFYSGQNQTGIPTRYDKTANGIFLDCIPNYSVASGLKIFINREGSYFVKTDTTKKAGFAGTFHEYLAIRPSHFYCKRNKMFDLAEQYKRDMLEMENAIEIYYSQRSRDEKLQIRTVFRSSR